ncbi:MAG: methyltransferase family protein [Myxococcota bacterium]
MALIEEFEKAGNWLFRFRSYLPLVVIGLLFAAMPEYEYLGDNETLNFFWEGFCLTVSFVGLGIRVITIGHTPRGTSGRNIKRQMANSLNTAGMYSVVRNPLYLGNFFMGLGVALFPHLWWLAVIYIFSFWLYYERIVFAEEAYLRDKFGSEFIDWAGVTPAIFPSFGRYRKAELPLSWKNVLRREHNGFFAIIVLMFAIDTVGEFFAADRIGVHRGWAVLLGIGFTIWITIRLLKKYTTVLKAEGR